MRNLIGFIRKYSFFFLFLAIEVLAFYLIFKNNHYQRASFLNSTNQLTGGIYQRYSNWTDYLNLKEVNERLSQENERLYQQQIYSYERLFGENILIRDTIFRKKFLYTKAKVVNNTVNHQNNYLTINVGSLNGIKSGMGVIGTDGVVGVVKNVSKNYASVVSVLNRDSRISVMLAGTEYFGGMEWDGEDYRKVQFDDVPKHVELQKGDTVVTSGFSALFPPGIKTAVITDFELPEGDNFYQIQMDLLLDFKQISHVYVVKNIDAIELQEHLGQTQQDD